MKSKPIVQVVVVCLFLLGSSYSSAQGKIRIVEGWGTPYPNQPIEIVGKELNDKAFLDQQRVLGDRDWLKHLTLSVKNISTKNILSFDIDLLVRRDGKILMGIPIHFRTYTSPAGTNSLTQHGDKKIGVLLPGEVVKVKVRDQAMRAWGETLRRYQVEDVDRVTLDLRAVYFDDQSRWMYGQESRPDPGNPHKRIRISAPEQKVNQRISDWIKYFLPPDSNYSFAFIFPAGSRIFFPSTYSRAASPPPPPTCVWYVDDELNRPTCSTFTTTNGCVDDDQSCVYEKFSDAIHTSDPGGAIKGIMQAEPYRCTINPTMPNPPTCSTCQEYTHDVFRPVTNCGSPGTCGQRSDWGCADGFVDIGGFCQRSAAYQQACPAGYDTSTCDCIPCYYQQNEEPTSPPQGGETFCGFCTDGADNDCNGVWDSSEPNCLPCWTPIVIDTLGNGFDLTSAAEGVDFDVAGVGRLLRVSWTQGDDAWLALDRNGNGTIDSGKELFGAVTYQNSSPERNGFRALSVYDEPGNGGNGDGKMDSSDSIFSSLRLWLDANHNGFSEPGELHELTSLGLAQLDLDYRMSGRVDDHGNRFRYRAKVYDAQGAHLGRWAWDVFLTQQAQTNRAAVDPDVSKLLASNVPIFGFKKPKCRG